MIEVSRRKFLGFAIATATLPVLAKYLGPPIETVPASAGMQATTIPPGSVFPYAGSQCPEGWLPCVGQVVSRAQYPALHRAVGTAFGSGPVRGTFRVPDLRGRCQAVGRATVGPWAGPQYLIKV